MLYVRLAALAAAVVVLGGSASPRALHSDKLPEDTTREVIAVYLGTMGTDAQSGMTTVVPEMKAALLRQAAASQRQFVIRGVSLEPLPERGISHLALLDRFDEISVGGNWINSSVVRYLGTTIGRDSSSSIPQVVLLERDVVDSHSTLQVSGEREIGRFIGTAAITGWVRRGAPLPQ